MHVGRCWIPSRQIIHTIINSKKYTRTQNRLHIANLTYDGGMRSALFSPMTGRTPRHTIYFWHKHDNSRGKKIPIFHDFTSTGVFSNWSCDPRSPTATTPSVISARRRSCNRTNRRPRSSVYCRMPVSSRGPSRSVMRRAYPRGPTGNRRGTSRNTIRSASDAVFPAPPSRWAWKIPLAWLVPAFETFASVHRTYCLLLLAQRNSTEVIEGLVY